MDNVDNILRQAGLSINAQGVLVYATDNANMWQSRLNVQADRIGLVVEGTGTNAHIKAAQIVASINTQTGTSKVLISADIIDIDGLVTLLEAKDIGCGDLTVEGDAYFYKTIYTEDSITAEDVIRSNTGFDPGDGHTYTAKSVSIMHATNFSTQRPFCYGSTAGVSGVVTGYVALGYTTTTIYYLGR
jgi:hypothetical protein